MERYGNMFLGYLHDCLDLGAQEGDCAWCKGDFMPASCVSVSALVQGSCGMMVEEAWTQPHTLPTGT